MTSIARPRSAFDVLDSVEDAGAALALLWARANGAVSEQVSPSQLRALLIVQAAGTSNLSGLAVSLGTMPSSASRLCDRLVAAGLLARVSAPLNRRETRLSLTPQAHRLLDSIRDRRRDALAAVLAAMPATRQSDLARGLSAFATAMRQELGAADEALAF